MARYARVGLLLVGGNGRSRHVADLAQAGQPLEAAIGRSTQRTL